MKIEDDQLGVEDMLILCYDGIDITRVIIYTKGENIDIGDWRILTIFFMPTSLLIHCSFICIISLSFFLINTYRNDEDTNWA